MTSSHRSPRIETAPEALDLSTLVPIANTSAWLTTEADAERMAARASAAALAVEVGALRRVPTRPERTVHHRYEALGALGGEMGDPAAVVVLDGRTPALLADVMASLGAVSMHLCSDIGDPCACHWTYAEDNEGACERCGLLVDGTYLLVAELREDNARLHRKVDALTADVDALLGLATRTTYLGDGITPAPSTSTPPRPSRATPAERLDLVAAVVRNAATADVEKQLRSAVGTLRWDLRDGFLLAEDVAPVLLDAATTRGRVTEPEARAILGPLLANATRKARP